jgi:hypothetical protein
VKVGEIGENDRLPASEPCDACKAEIAEHKRLVAEGGVYWRCLKCGSEGVIKDSEFAQNIRKMSNHPAPEPVGIEFNGPPQCPTCVKNA